VKFLPELVSNPNLSPLHATSIEKLGREWTKPGNLMGNGAYLLKGWQVNNKIVLEKSLGYWNADQVKITRVTYLPVEDGHVDVKLFESGQNDWVYMLPPGSYDSYLKKYPKDTRNTPLLALRFYSIQTQSPFFKDVRVRQALSMVLDRDILAQKVTADGQLPAYGLIVKGVEGADRIDYEWANWPMAKKVETAKALMEQAGVKPGSKFTFSYNTSEYHKKMAIFAASEWKTKLGLTVELEAMEFKVLIKKRHDGQFEMARDGWNADYNDATTFVALVKCDSDQNHSRHCNKEAEQLIQKGLKESDQAKRKVALNEAIRLIMNDYPMIPLLQYSLPRLVKSYVGGYSTDNQMDRFRTQDLYIIKH
jgi:oligopeptide transport system substrate-binding protein